MEKDMTVLKIVEEDGNLVMLFEREMFEKMGLRPGSYVLIEKKDDDTYLVRNIGTTQD